MAVIEMTKDYLLTNFHDFMRVKDLKDFIKNNNMPDNAIVVIQRVEDVYYEENHWQVYCKEGDQCYYLRRMNKAIDAGEYATKISKASDADIMSYREQYHPAWCCVYYPDDPEILFIDLHY